MWGKPPGSLFVILLIPQTKALLEFYREPRASSLAKHGLKWDAWWHYVTLLGWLTRSKWCHHPKDASKSPQFWNVPNRWAGQFGDSKPSQFGVPNYVPYPFGDICGLVHRGVEISQRPDALGTKRWWRRGWATHQHYQDSGPRWVVYHSNNPNMDESKPIIKEQFGRINIH